MLMYTAGLLFFFVGADFIHAQLNLDDPCYLTTVSDLSDTDSQEIPISIPADCTSGNIDWHYPKGSLHLIATPSDSATPFSFCIGESWATMIGGVHELTGGLNNQLSLPTTDNPACTSSQKGNAELLVTAELTQYYMTTFTYTVKPLTT